MNVKKITYALSIGCFVIAFVFALAPGLFSFLNSHDSKAINYFFAFVMAYVGVGSAVVVRFLERRKNREARRNKIFIISSPDDYLEASQISASLQDRGYNVWFSGQHLLPGQILEKQIQSVLDNSAAAVLLASGAELPAFAKDELTYFLKNRNVKDENFIPIMPVLIGEGGLPPELENVVYVRYEDEQLIDKLARSLECMLKK